MAAAPPIGEGPPAGAAFFPGGAEGDNADGDIGLLFVDGDLGDGGDAVGGRGAEGAVVAVATGEDAGLIGLTDGPVADCVDGTPLAGWGELSAVPARSASGLAKLASGGHSCTQELLAQAC